MPAERARCAYHPKIVLREHFDDRKGPNGSIYTTPNGTFSCLRCDEERDRHQLEPPAEAQGRWTREAPTEAGLYVFVDPTGRTFDALVSEAGDDDVLMYGWWRWSTPIVLPPPPTEASGT